MFAKNVLVIGIRSAGPGVLASGQTGVVQGPAWLAAMLVAIRQGRMRRKCFCP